MQHSKSRKSFLLSIGAVAFFLLAVVSAEFLGSGIFVSLALVVVGGFAMTVSTILSEKRQPPKIETKSIDEEELLA